MLKNIIKRIMGTNFYKIIPVAKRKQQEIKDLITDNPCLWKIRDLLDEIEKNNIIHLGKRSFGWQFLWDFNDGKFYAPSLESIKAFLDTGEGWIEDEYGEKFTTNEFLEDEIGGWLYKDENHCDLQSYQEKHPKEQRYYADPKKHEFISSDGLRFSKDTNFS